MISVESSGSFDKTEGFIKRVQTKRIFNRLDQYGKEGLDALRSATPVDEGLTASSWQYEITRIQGKYIITWSNTNVVSGVPVVILLQYGHATGGGGWVEGTDYINPAIVPLFEKFTNDVWTEVIRDA